MLLCLTRKEFPDKLLATEDLDAAPPPLRLLLRALFILFERS
jgi:hypothetical protein